MDELIPTRTTLLRRLKDWRDQSSWQEFYDTYWRLINFTALKAGLNESEAEEVVQETMIAVARHMPSFKYDPAIGSFKAWLFRLTRWRINDQLRKRKPLALHESLSDDSDASARMVDDMVDPMSQNLSAVWDAEWQKNLLDAAIASVKRRMDPQKYQIFDLNVNKGWEAARVAAQFGISIHQVYLAKHRVTKAIKDEAKRLGKEKP